MARITDQDDQGRIRERFIDLRQAGTNIDPNTTLIEWIDAFLDTGAQGLTEVLESHATDRVFGQLAIHMFRLPITQREYNDLRLQMLKALLDADILDAPWPSAFPAEKHSAPTSNTGLKSDDPLPSGAGADANPDYRYVDGDEFRPF